MPYDEQTMDGEPEGAKPSRAPKTLQLEAIAGEGTDLAFLLDDDDLQKIAGQCLEGYERDKSERAEWEKDYDTAMSMVKGERQPKTFPWPGAANVIYPLISTASLQFGSRCYPAIVKGRDVAKMNINGEDPDGMKRDRADRVAEHMNWQLLEDMPEWEDETDKLVHMLPTAGCLFRQVIWDETYTRPKTSLVSAKDLVVTQSCKDLETVPQFCKEFSLYPHEIKEKQADEQYVQTEIQFSGEHEQAPQDMLECHCRYDLDDDGYDEPYIAIVHKDTQKLLSLKAGFWPRGVERGENGKIKRVRRHVEFIKYDFMPDPEGGFLGIGFGFLLREHNQIINTIINQLLDAATDQNAGGGFIGRGVNLKGGKLEFTRGEWKFVNATGTDLRSNMVPRPVSQPSPVLYQMLELMIESGKELASIRDALSGEVQANQPATTTLAIIEQGLQVFSSIYKRIYRSLGKELQLIYTLNGAYLPDEAYFTVLDDQKAVARSDYAQGDYDVRPVADPSITTSAQRLAKAQFLGSFLQDPRVDGREIIKRMLEAADIEHIELLLPEPGPEQAMMGMMEARGKAAEVSEKEASTLQKTADAEKKEAETAKIRMETALEPVKTQMDAADRDRNAQMNDEHNRGKLENERTRDRQRVAGQDGGVAGVPGDAGLPQGAGQPGQGAGAGGQGPVVPEPGEIAGPANGALPGPGGGLPGIG